MEAIVRLPKDIQPSKGLLGLSGMVVSGLAGEVELTGVVVFFFSFC